MKNGTSLGNGVSAELDLVGGMTGASFPRVEKLLQKRTTYQRQIMAIAAKKGVSAYRSLLDFLFCELQIQFKRPCQEFYAGKGPALEEIIAGDEKKQERYENILLIALELAVETREGKKRSWSWFRGEVIKRAHQAAG